MSDIQKCIGYDTRKGTCWKKMECKRYTARAEPLYQVYGDPAPDFEDEKGCELFYPNTPVATIMVNPIQTIHIEGTVTV